MFGAILEWFGIHSWPQIHKRTYIHQAGLKKKLFFVQGTQKFTTKTYNRFCCPITMLSGKYGW